MERFMNRNHLAAAVAAGLICAAGPAVAALPTGGIETFTTDIWDFMIRNIGLMIVGLAIIGALIGALVGDPGRGIGRAIVGAAIGAFIGAVPAVAEYVLGLA
jgi:hypothetical protein